MTSIQKINALPSSKDELKDFVSIAKAEILSGNHNPLHIAGMLKIMEEIVKEIRADVEVKRYIEDEAEKYVEKTIDFEKFKITKSGRSSKDYSICGDKVYNDLVSEMSTLKEVIKAREKMLDTGINPDTGEEFIKPLSKYQSIISISLK